MTNARPFTPHEAITLDRRRFLMGTAACAGMAASGLTLPTAAAGAGLSTLRPLMADSVADSFGVVIHPSWRETTYADHDELLAWLLKLGIRHVRTRLTPQKDVFRLFHRLSENGIKVNAVCGAFGDSQTMDSLMKAVSEEFAAPAKVFSAFEGINEPNNDGVAWIEETRAKTQALYEARKKYGLTAVPIIAPALARVNGDGVEGDDTLAQARNLGDMSAWVDGGTMHIYPRGLPPSNGIDYFTQCAQQVAGSKPITVTEGGYFTAPQYSGGARRVSGAVAAAYGPQKLLEHMLAGNTRYFRYELLEKPTGRSWDRLATFGMLRTDRSQWRPKAEFSSTRRLLAKFKDPGTPFTPEPLTYSLSGPGSLKSMVFAKRDGTHLLALWLDRRIWDPDKQRLLISGTKDRIGTAVLELGSGREGVVTHVVDYNQRKRFGRTTSVRVPLTAGVTVVKLRT